MICSNLCKFGRTSTLFLRLCRSLVLHKSHLAETVREERGKEEGQNSLSAPPVCALRQSTALRNQCVAQLGSSSLLLVFAACFSDVQGSGRLWWEGKKKEKSWAEFCCEPAVWNVAKNNQGSNVAKRKRKLRKSTVKKHLRLQQAAARHMLFRCCSTMLNLYSLKEKSAALSMS